MEPIVVVGAGLSGVTCARAVAAAGLPVTVLERSRKPGGRMASRLVEGRRVDLGASYLTVADDRFAAVVDRWRDAGLARPWTDTFDARDEDGAWQPKPGPLRWGAPQGLRSLVEHEAAGLKVRTATVTRVDRVDGGLRVDDVSAPAVVLAMPDPQARRLLGPGLADVAEQLDDPFEPILALTAVWDERTWDLDGAFVNGSDVLGWVADDGRRRGDGAPVLVAHSTPDLARGHLEDPAAAGPALVAELRAVLDLDEPRHTEVNRWTFAKPTGSRERTFLLDDGLGVCGDAWSATAKVESAFLSGRELGEALVARFA
ncbi:NAD(P)-binding protein [Nocardioides sp. HDW12B]|uniref:NAD(P)/FAD-dependent oxidoreductase n=1 Tax=Nocardioides sp. HDW12B TaxID=2714939 RepID=UPI0014087615|nr:FAD-dependent oxidoreductase [Nocardioides sp. HDW12B]QIK66704.1 NAD(P)-binding protein [Nocardioides sp. HDW12B]